MAKPNSSYASWISANYPTAQSAVLSCAEATQRMSATFPELLRTRGEVMVGVDYRPHWWCVSPDGTIVDPTVHQWPQKVTIYEIVPLDDEVNGGDFEYLLNDY